MLGIITPLKKHWVFPTLGFLVSIFLVTGLLLNCCHTNEILVASLGRIFSFTSHHDLTAIEAEDHDASTHEHCHSLEINTGNEISAQPEAIANQNGFGELARYAVPEHCLSEKGFSTLPMVGSDFVYAPIAIAVAEVFQVRPTQLALLPESPRPQNKSSPPLYLTLRHLLI